jgi:hypothetical protein
MIGRTLSDLPVEVTPGASFELATGLGAVGRASGRASP